MASAGRKGIRKIYKTKSGSFLWYQTILMVYIVLSQDLVYLSVGDSRENIEAVHHLTAEVVSPVNVEVYCTIYCILDEGLASSPLIRH